MSKEISWYEAHSRLGSLWYDFQAQHKGLLAQVRELILENEELKNKAEGILLKQDEWDELIKVLKIGLGSSFKGQDVYGAIARALKLLERSNPAELKKAMEKEMEAGDNASIDG